MVIDKDVLQSAYEKLATMNAAESHEAVDDPDQPESNHILELQTLKVIDAFSIPRLAWSEERKLFEEPTGAGAKPSLLGQPMSKILYLRDRYHTIRQVIFRNEHFSPPAVGGALGEAEREEYMKVR
jgi:DNA polymerase epsilon subunit 2